MASYAVFYLAGMYPLPATNQFLLSSPYFPQIEFYNPIFNSTTTIKTVDFPGNPTSGTGGTVFVKVGSTSSDTYRAWYIPFYRMWLLTVSRGTQTAISSGILSSMDQSSSCIWRMSLLLDAERPRNRFLPHCQLGGIAKWISSLHMLDARKIG